MLGDFIARKREEKGLRSVHLARMVGCAPSNIYYIEKGILDNPSFKLICNISDALGISIDELKREFQGCGEPAVYEEIPENAQIILSENED